MRYWTLLFFLVCSVPAAATSSASNIPVIKSNQVYFGDLHVHTSYSLDSYIFGNRNDPDAAFRFAMGEPLTLYGGAVLRLRKPLDFVAITDHAEFLGELFQCTQPDSETYGNQSCRGIRSGDFNEFGKLVASLTEKQRQKDICTKDVTLCDRSASDSWHQLISSAERFYRPGEFTTLIGFEYSATIAPSESASKDLAGKAPGMLHRNVIFRTNKVPPSVFSAYDGTGEELLRWLVDSCTGSCAALSIPHNPNYSWGRFFWPDRNSDGSAWDEATLRLRARLEPQVEIFQIKGSSECQRSIGLADEECGFENVVPVCRRGETENCAGDNSFVRDALVRGLAAEQRWGINPFRYGFIASTDNHNGTPGAVDEAAFKGHLAQQDDSPAKRLGVAGEASPNSAFKLFNPGGLAAVWAERNTRESIWDGLQRRETYATSGTRVRVRFFAGYDLPESTHLRPDRVEVGYASGVPMGGLLVGGARTATPRFSVWADRDPDSAPLQKLQIVKGWIQGGKPAARVFDIVCADGLKADTRTGLCPDNGASVNASTCAVDSESGAAELATTWVDPDFHPEQAAVYYVRVIENPVCRWSAYDAEALGLSNGNGSVDTIKERAWTSPIWFKPGLVQ